ncbi:MAG TPA: hypothetical protein VHO28_10930 [Ignavibacteriales bacterium]|nr:hypothetical protein [Ignavibacteriales bacterium]HEX3073224.1 hypothetical protein [Ignavibacteriales bacterium]
MKRAAIITAIFAISLFITGCGVNDYDDTPPVPPAGIHVYNGDRMAEITWVRNRERDIAGYNVYYSMNNYEFKLLGSTTNDYFVDRGEDVQNGDKYYYAVTAYDYDGNESDLSQDVVYAAPRPEGYNIILDNSMVYASTSGYSFDVFRIRPYNSIDTDFFFTIDPDGRAYLDIYGDSDPNDGKDDGTYIKDMGTTRDIYDIEFAPETFPNELYAEAFVGHTYVIWTWNNRFAKIRIKSIGQNSMTFDWAYQTREGEPMLKRTSKERGALDIESKIKSLKERGIEIHK